MRKKLFIINNTLNKNLIVLCGKRNILITRRNIKCNNRAFSINNLYLTDLVLMNYYLIFQRRRDKYICL